jgi:uncharacterized protein YndB with AHSA1/START domain
MAETRAGTDAARDSATKESGHRLVVRRVLPAGAEAVFDAWTDAASMRDWMCPGPVVEARAQLDARVGGSFVIDMVGANETFHHTGQYLEVDRPRKLVFTWISPATHNAPSRVTVELIPRGPAQTELVLTHEKLPTADSAKNHEMGWGSILEKLEKSLKTED